MTERDELQGDARDGSATDPDATPIQSEAMNPGRRMTALLAWLIAVGLVALIGSSQYTPEDADAGSGTPSVVPQASEIEAFARVAIGLNQVSPSSAADLVDDLSAAAAGDDQLRVVVLRAEVSGLERAREALAEARPALRGERARVAETLAALYAGETVSEAGRTLLRERLGWCGELAVTWGMDAEQAPRSEVLAAAQTALGMLALGLVLVVLLGLASLVLFAWALVRIRNRRVQTRMQVLHGDTAGIVAFAAFLLGFLGYQLIALGIANALEVELPLWSMWGLLMLAPPWLALLRSETSNWREVFTRLGWHRGDGVLREMGAGLLGYLAGIPLVLLGVIVANWLMQLGASEPQHPIQQEIGATAGVGWLVLLSMVSLWAPLVEETVFRGALYHHLRSWSGITVSVMAQGVLFAAVHPQGLSGIPVLAALGCVFGLIREWRGSLIGCVTAHAVHNGAAIGLMWVLYG